MVYTSINPNRQSYRLWKRFRMPTSHGTSDAVAVEAWVGHELNSAYTFLLEHIVLLVWALMVFFGSVLSLRIYAKRHPHTTITKELWAKRSSPYGMLKLTIKQLIQPRYRVLLIFLWIFLSLAFLVAKYAIPIVFARYIIIDQAAPVSAEAIYFPTYVGIGGNAAATDPRTILEIFALEVPSAVRALGGVDNVHNTISGSPQVNIDQPEIMDPDPLSGDPNQRINYRYNVTGLDFGLQHYPDLILSVEGSCQTDYTWYGGPSPSTSDPTLIADIYYLFNQSNLTETVSADDGPSPAGQFFVGMNGGNQLVSNWTWATLISSVNKSSYQSSDDPWYLTVPDTDPQNPPFRVKSGRPALSCWQNDVWSYHGKNSSVAHLNSSDLPGLELSPAMQDIFSHFLGQPKIPVLGTRLGVQSLKSASTSYYNVFNASSSSLYSDLERLVFASYIGTVNTLTETTLFVNNATVTNDVMVIGGGSIPSGIDEFVIWSPDITTLSVKSLIIIPVLTATLWLIALLVFLLPLPEIVVLSAKISGKIEGTTGEKPPKSEEKMEGKSEEESETQQVVKEGGEKLVEEGKDLIGQILDPEESGDPV